MKSGIEKSLLILLQYVGSALLRLYFNTLKLKHDGIENLEKVNKAGSGVFSTTHGRMFIPSMIHSRHRVTVLISQSKDGEIAARLFKGLGCNVVRGSSHKGGVAGLKAAIKAVKKAPMAITMDGPRGPIDEPKMGVIAIARSSGYTILPMVGACEKSWEFNSWDKFQIPKPFSKILVSYGTPIEVPRRADSEEMETLRLKLKEVSIKLKENADLKIKELSR